VTLLESQGANGLGEFVTLTGGGITTVSFTEIQIQVTLDDVVNMRGNQIGLLAGKESSIIAFTECAIAKAVSGATRSGSLVCVRSPASNTRNWLSIQVFWEISTPESTYVQYVNRQCHGFAVFATHILVPDSVSATVVAWPLSCCGIATSVSFAMHLFNPLGVRSYRESRAVL